MSEALTIIITFLIIYLGYLALWVSINLIAYYVSLVTKKRAILNGLTALVTIFMYILNFGIWISLAWWAITLLIAGQFLWFLFLIFIGITLISGILSYIQLPFYFVSAYFTDKIENIDLDEDVTTTELLDNKGKIVDKIEGRLTIQKRIGKYLLGAVGSNVILLLLNLERYNPIAVEFISLPIFWTITNSLICMVPVLIYNLLKYKRVKGRSWSYSLINILRLEIIITVVPPILGTLYLIAAGLLN